MTIWMAYYSDFSSWSLFETELEALRHAVEHSMKVKAVQLPAIDVRGSVK